MGQNQQYGNQNNYANPGMMQQQQMGNFPMQQMPNMPGNAFQFPAGVVPQQFPVNMNPQQQSGHRRNQSAVSSGGNMGPPPAPAGL
jgi:hypothetical protein